MLEMTDRDSGLAGDVVQAQILGLARDPEPLAHRLAQQLILIRFRHRFPLNMD
jgi:hypothetical protein